MASKYKLSGGTCAWRGCRKTSKGELPRGNRCPASPLARSGGALDLPAAESKTAQCHHERSLSKDRELASGG
jgi:hypothetical protein